MKDRAQYQKLTKIEKLVRSSFSQKIGMPLRHSFDLKLSNISANFINEIITEINKKQQETRQASEVILLLSWNCLGVRGCQILSQAGCLNLAVLTLNNNQVLDLGCWFISRGNWLHLRKLSIDCNGITQKGCKHLSKASWINMKDLSIRFNPVGEHGHMYLMNTFAKDCKIRSDQNQEQE